MANTVRTSDDLREALFSTIEGVKNKDIKPAEAKAICELAGKIIDITDTELDIAQFYSRFTPPGDGPSLQPIRLTGSTLPALGAPEDE